LQFNDNELIQRTSNIYILLQFYLTIPVSNCTGERSLSHMKRIKSVLRSSMSQERMSNTAFLNIDRKV